MHLIHLSYAKGPPCTMKHRMLTCNMRLALQHHTIGGPYYTVSHALCTIQLTLKHIIAYTQLIKPCTLYLTSITLNTGHCEVCKFSIQGNGGGKCINREVLPSQSMYRRGLHSKQRIMGVGLLLQKLLK